MTQMTESNVIIANGRPTFEQPADVLTNAPMSGSLPPPRSRDTANNNIVQEAIRADVVHKSNATTDASSFAVTPDHLSSLANERTRLALVETIEIALKNSVNTTTGGDVEDPSADRKVASNILALCAEIRETPTDLREMSPEEHEADKNAEVAAAALASLVLKSSSEQGLHSGELEHRRALFGTNAIASRKLDSFLKLCYEAVQDFVLFMLIALGVISIVVETTIGLEEGETCGVCWIEGAAILVSVVIVVLVTASIDYAKQFQFVKLSRSLHETNTKVVTRDGQQVSIIDDEIVVGDILSVNSHNLASIPADCVLLGPNSDLRMDESALTGESKLIVKKPGDVILSGTTAAQGSGKMVVIAVGKYSVSGKIRARVYEQSEDGLDGDDENSPLFVKLDSIAKSIGLIGTCCAVLAFAAACIIGLAINEEPASHLIEYLILSITVLAVAVPEGLPLAVTLALAFSSNKMMKDQNLVKHLDACETMGCATTICTDKTGV